MGGRYNTTIGPLGGHYDEIKEEFKKFLKTPRTKKEIKAKFNMTEPKFRSFISQVGTYWPVYQDFTVRPYLFGWLE